MKKEMPDQFLHTLTAAFECVHVKRFGILYQGDP